MRSSEHKHTIIVVTTNCIVSYYISGVHYHSNWLNLVIYIYNIPPTWAAFGKSICPECKCRGFKSHLRQLIFHLSQVPVFLSFFLSFHLKYRIGSKNSPECIFSTEFLKVNFRGKYTCSSRWTGNNYFQRNWRAEKSILHRWKVLLLDAGDDVVATMDDLETAGISLREVQVVVIFFWWPNWHFPHEATGLKRLVHGYK